MITRLDSTKRPTPRSRVWGWFAATIVCVIALLVGVIVVATAYESDSYNTLQLVAGGLMAVGLLGTGILFGRFTSSGAGLSAMLIAAVVSLVLFALWMYGFSSWCDGCGIR